MKISIWNIFILIAIIALGLGFAMHVYVTEQRLAIFQNGACHEMPHVAFFARLDAVRNNFENAGIELQSTAEDYEWAAESGTFIREFSWNQNQAKKLSSRRVHQLTLPLTRRLGDEASPWIRWNVEIIPNIRPSDDNSIPVDSNLKFRIRYLIDMPKI